MAKIQSITTAIFLLLTANLLAQTTITGKVTDPKGAPIVGANVYIDQRIEGAVSDVNGAFKFNTSATGLQTLVVSLIGFETDKSPITCNATVNVTVVLKESVTTLNAVNIIAGSYEASDKKRTAVMTPLDVYTTSGSVGDVTGAFRTLPGSQAAPEDGRLLVRGGEAYETKTYMDGLLIGNPYNSKVPDLPTRGRFSPNLFSGTAFNTGGYSAEFGQALSSVMLLSSTDLELEPSTSFSLMSLGSELNHTWVKRQQSVQAGAGYFNMAPYLHFAHTRMDWTKPTESGNAHLIYRKQTEKGLLKAFVTGSTGQMGLNIPSGKSTDPMAIDNQTDNVYANVTYRETINDRLSYITGVSSSLENTDMQIDTMTIRTKENTYDVRFKLIADVSAKVKLIAGVEEFINLYQQDYRQNRTSTTWHGQSNWHVASQYVETEIRPIAKLAIRAGLRGEYGSMTTSYNASPRLSLAVKTAENSQLSFAYGHFNQMAENDYLKFNPHLGQQQANHWIASFQTGTTDTRLLRAEGYWKSYDNLVRYSQALKTQADGYNNSGYGYAKGIDLFFRDKKSVKNGDFWVSYSWIDTKRLYNDFDEKATPTFIAKHTVNVVSKYYIKQLTSQVSGTYTYASGKPYHNPDKAGFMNSQTPYYGNLSLSWSYLTNLGNNFTVFYLSVSNVLGRNNIYGYRNIPSTNQSPERLVPVAPDQKRFVFVGMFINLL